MHCHGLSLLNLICEIHLQAMVEQHKYKDTMPKWCEPEIGKLNQGHTKIHCLDRRNTLLEEFYPPVTRENGTIIIHSINEISQMLLKLIYISCLELSNLSFKIVSPLDLFIDVIGLTILDFQRFNCQSPLCHGQSFLSFCVRILHTKQLIVLLNVAAEESFLFLVFAYSHHPWTFLFKSFLFLYLFFFC